MTKKARIPKTPDVRPEAGQRWTPRDHRSTDLREIVSVLGKHVNLKNLVAQKTTKVSLDTLYKEYAYAGNDKASAPAATPASVPPPSMPW